MHLKAVMEKEVEERAEDTTLMANGRVIDVRPPILAF